MDIKKLAEKMRNAKYSSNDLDHCLVAQDYLSEMLYNSFVDKVQKAMEELEEAELDEQRGKPKTRAEWAEYVGEV